MINYLQDTTGETETHSETKVQELVRLVDQYADLQFPKFASTNLEHSKLCGETALELCYHTGSYDPIIMYSALRMHNLGQIVPKEKRPEFSNLSSKERVIFNQEMGYLKANCFLHQEVVENIVNESQRDTILKLVLHSSDFPFFIRWYDKHDDNWVGFLEAHYIARLKQTLKNKIKLDIRNSPNEFLYNKFLPYNNDWSIKEAESLCNQILEKQLLQAGFTNDYTSNLSG